MVVACVVEELAATSERREQLSKRSRPVPTFHVFGVCYGSADHVKPSRHARQLPRETDDKCMTRSAAAGDARSGMLLGLLNSLAAGCRSITRIARSSSNVRTSIVSWTILAALLLMHLYAAKSSSLSRPRPIDREPPSNLSSPANIRHLDRPASP